ncbi:PEGA domain-containing protein [Candidatus Berkelbacteria bacterium]|nr:PEGA domain-containing protein [Candidatus Berkelbacteria bacterium]
MGKRHAIPFLLWAVIIGSFFLVSSWIISSATGYRFNAQSGRFQKTSFLKIRTDPREATVVLQGKQVAVKTPWEAKRLFPGNYDITIEKPGYHSWAKNVTIEPSQALILDRIVLFKQALSQEASPEEAVALDKANPPDDLYFQGGEIFSAERIITRRSRDVAAATWYPNKNYVVYQIDSEIRVVELDGSNDLKLADLEAKKASKFSVSNNGELLFYRDGESAKKLVLI